MPLIAYCVKYFDTNIGKILKIDDSQSDDANAGRSGRGRVDFITSLLHVFIITFDGTGIFK